MKFRNKNCYETFPHRKRSSTKKRNPSPKFGTKPYKKIPKVEVGSRRPTKKKENQSNAEVSRSTYKKERKFPKSEVEAKNLQKRKKSKSEVEMKYLQKKKKSKLQRRSEVPTKRNYKFKVQEGRMS